MKYAVVHFIRSPERSVPAKKQIERLGRMDVANIVYSVVSFIP